MTAGYVLALTIIGSLIYIVNVHNETHLAIVKFTNYPLLLSKMDSCSLFCREITVLSMGSGCCKMLWQCSLDATYTKIKLLRYSLLTDVSFLSVRFNLS